MARSKNPGDLSAIAQDYNDWRLGRKFSLGFEADLDARRWDPPFYEPIEFGLADVKFPYEIVDLGRIAEIVPGKLSDTAKIAINRTGSKSVDNCR